MSTRDGGVTRFACGLPPVGWLVRLAAENIPLIALPTVAALLGIAGLRAKLEPVHLTGSDNDRTAAMPVYLAVDQGYPRRVVTPSGNAGLAMAACGTPARIPGLRCLGAAVTTGRPPGTTTGAELRAARVAARGRRPRPFARGRR